MTSVSALVSFIMTACGAQMPAPRAPQPDSVYEQQLTNGVTHRYRWYASGPWAVHSLAIEPKACVAVRAAKAQDRMVGREQTTSIARRAAATDNVIAAINADFFSFDPPGISEGPQVSNGVLLKSEGAHREALEDRRLRLQPVFAIDRRGRPVVRHTRLHGSVHIGRQTLPLAGVNVRPRNDSTFVFTTFWGDTTPVDSTAIELIVRNGRVSGVDSAATGVAIPADGFVVALKGRSAGTGIASGEAVTWSAELEGLRGAREMAGGYPMLLLNGAPVHHDEAGLRQTFADRRHPRAAIGTDRQGRIHIFAVDGRQPGRSDGMSLQELGDFLIAHGITDALNLDGGGSTTFVVRGQIANRPSDTNGERAVANALLVIDQGRSGSCARNR